MATQIFINLSVKDLERSKEFFSHLGFAFEPEFSDQNGICLIIADNIFAMLLVEEFFKTFTDKQICNTTTHSESILALSLNSRAEVDDMMLKVIEAGGTEQRLAQDQGWMYGRSFLDPDGHHWEVFYMDTAAMPKS